MPLCLCRACTVLHKSLRLPDLKKHKNLNIHFYFMNFALVNLLDFPNTTFPTKENGLISDILGTH